jgi:cell division protein FtsA
MDTMQPPTQFFVLDIGTRFIRGIIAERVQEPLRDYIVVRHAEVLEHEERAMFAGQIHDIDKVARVVRLIKERLEQKTGYVLTKAASAVAGRNLYTCRGMFTYARPEIMEPISETEIKQIELSAVQNALETTFTDDRSKDYCCVGYSPVEYRLDNETIKNLLGHRGTTIETDAIVTLLPYKVLDSMFAVLGQCGLELSFLTLEPIAALEAAVPRDIYYLNLVLVDIGAGTSDIASTAAGKVMAYGMVPHAGDEITEAISKQLLIDFNEAERLKREAAAHLAVPEAMLSYRDIFGRTYEQSAGAVLEIVRPKVRELAGHIAAELRGLADGSFLAGCAVILVGGGSLTPFIEDEVSAACALARDRIGTRAGAVFVNIVNETERLRGPEAATCLGIALLAAKRQALSLIHVTINDVRRTLLRVNDERLNVLSALLSSGFNMRQVYGRPGMAKTYTLNGELRSLRGKPPRPAIVTVNDAAVALDAELKEGDCVTVHPALDGVDAQARIADVVRSDKTITVNGEETAVPLRVFVNGREMDPETEIADRDEITTQDVASVASLLIRLGYDVNSFFERNVCLHVNGEPLFRHIRNYDLTINGDTRSLFAENQTVAPGDRIEFRSRDAVLFVRDFIERPQPGRDLRVKINGEEYTFPGAEGRILLNGEKAVLDAPVKDGDLLISADGKDAEAVLVDIFRHLTLDPQDQAGRKLRLMINNNDAQFTSPLFDGAEVKVAFE